MDLAGSLAGLLSPWLGPAAAALVARLISVAISVVVVAPLALLMGMPFPSGLRRLHDPAAIPWAWGINGTASVLSSMVATLVAVHFGFTTVVAAAALLAAVLGKDLDPDIML